MQFYFVLCFIVFSLVLSVSASRNEILAQEFFNSSTGTSLQGGLLTPGCFPSSLAFFNQTGLRRILFEPTFRSGRIKISFRLFTSQYTSNCPFSDPKYSSFLFSHFDLEPGQISILSPSLSPHSFSLLYENFFPTPTTFVLQQVLIAPNQSDVWGVNQLSLSCEAITCPQIGFENLNFYVLNLNFQTALPSSSQVSGGSIIASSSSAPCSNFSSFSSLWMSDTSQRSLTLSSLNISNGALLSFQLNVPPQCDIPSKCNCTSDPITNIWINEVVTNNLNISSPIWLDYTLTPSASFLLANYSGSNLTFPDTISLASPVLTPRYITSSLRSSLFNQGAGMGFEIAGTPGFNLSGYYILVFGSSTLPNATSDNYNFQCLLTGGNPPKTDLLDFPISTTAPFYLWKILDFMIPANTFLSTEPGTTSRIGLASFSYNWNWSAACILAGLPGNLVDTDLSGHSCHIFLMNPLRNLVLHRLIIGPWNNAQIVLTDWLMTSGSSNSTLPYLPWPCPDVNADAVTIPKHSKVPSCMSRQDSLLGSTCLNCREYTLDPRYNTTNFPLIPRYGDVGCVPVTSKYCTGQYNCQDIEVATPGLFSDQGCSKRSTLFSILHPSLSILPQAGHPDCFTPWWELQNFTFARNTLRTLFSSNDDNYTSLLPIPTSTPQLSSSVDGYSTRNRRLTSDILFSCSNLNYDTSFCCGVSSSSTYLSLEGRSSSSGSWRLIENLNTQNIPSSVWISYDIALPSWLSSSSAQIRWIQTWFDTLSPILLGSQTWGLDNITIVDQAPVASFANTALLVSPTSNLTITQQTFSSISQFTFSFWLFFTGPSPDFPIIQSPGLSFVFSSNLNFSISCSSGSQFVTNSLPSFSVWHFYSLFMNTSHITLCTDSTCLSSSHFCIGLQSLDSFLISSPVVDFLIDEVRFYSYFLPPSIIFASSTRPLRSSELADPYLEFLFHFDEAACGDVSSQINSDLNTGYISSASACTWVPSSVPLYFDLYLDRASLQFQGSILLPAFDVEDSPLLYRILSYPACGTLFSSSSNQSLPISLNTLISPELSYLLSLNTCLTASQDFFNYSVTDSAGTVSIGIVTISMTPPPSIFLSTISEFFDQTIYYTSTSDIDLFLSSSPIKLLTPPTYGTVMDGSTPLSSGQFSSSGNLTFRFAPGFQIENPPSLSDFFSYAPSISLPSEPSKVTLIRRSPLAYYDSGYQANCGQILILSDLLFNDYFLSSDASLISISSIGSTTSHGLDFSTDNGGSLVLLGQTVIYQAPRDYSGPDAFSYVLSLGLYLPFSSLANVTLSVDCPFPAAINQSLTVNQSSSLVITLLPNISTSSYFITSLPKHGQLFETLGGLNTSNPFSLQMPLPWLLPTFLVLYIPESDFSGSDLFSFSVQTVDSLSVTGIISISVLPLDGDPSAFSFSLTLAQNVSNISVSFASHTSNPTSSTLSFSIDIIPSHGTLFCLDTFSVISANGSLCENITYTPTPNFVGSDALTFRALNSHGYSNQAVVSFVIVSSGPSADDSSFAILMNTELILTLSSLSTPSDSSNSYFISSLPTHGLLYDMTLDQLHLSPISSVPSKLIFSPVGYLKYQPLSNFNGFDSFSWNFVDSNNAISRTAIIVINVSSAESPPFVNVSSLLVLENSLNNPLSLQARTFRPPLSYTPILNTVSGKLAFTNHTILTDNSTLSSSNLLYTPSPYFSGFDLLPWQVTDFSGFSTLTTQEIIISPLPNPPFLSDTFIFSLQTSSPSPAPLLINFDPVDPDYTSLLMVFLRTLPPNGRLFMTIDGTSPSGSALSINSTGSVTYPFTFIYIPNSGFFGLETFFVQACDSFLLCSNLSSVIVSVLPLDGNPFSPAFTVYIYEGNPSVINLSAFNGSSLGLNPAYQIISTPNYPLYIWMTNNSQGTRLFASDLTGPSLYYVPPARGQFLNYSLIFDQFTYRSFQFSLLNGLPLYSPPALVTIFILNLNDPPITWDSFYSLPNNHPLLIIPKFDDPDLFTSPQNLTLIVTSLPSSGQLLNSATNITVFLNQQFLNQDPAHSVSFFYLPGSAGNFSFQFQVIDNSGLNSSSTIWIRVNSPPTVLALNFTGSQHLPIDFSLTAQDDTTGLDRLIFTFSSLGNLSSGGSLFADCSNSENYIYISSGLLPFSYSDCQLRFLPFENFFGTLILPYFVTDEDGASSASSLITLTITLNLTTPLLIPRPQFIVVTENSNASISLDSFNSNSYYSSASFYLATSPLSGTLMISGFNLTSGDVILSGSNMIYVPFPQYIGFDTFSYYSSADGLNSTNSSRITIWVKPSSLPPPGLSMIYPYNKSDILSILLDSTDFIPPSFFPYILSLPSQGNLYITPQLETVQLTPPTPIALGNSLLSYESNFGAIGFDNFTFAWCNFAACGPPATIQINISTFDYPLIHNISLDLDQDISSLLTLTAIDFQPPGGSLNYSVIQQPAKVLLTFSSSTSLTSTYSLTPPPNFVGADKFVYRVTDQTGLFSTASVNLQVYARNAPPQPILISSSVNLGNSVTISLLGDDLDSIYLSPDLLTFEIVSLPLLGYLSDSSGLPISVGAIGSTFNYTAPTTLNLQLQNTTFEFLVFDVTNRVSGTVGVVSLSIFGNNTSPLTFGFLTSTQENVQLLIDLTSHFYDPDPQTFTFKIASVPAPSEGFLYQFNASSNSSLSLVSPNDVLTDPGHRLWFQPAPDFFCPSDTSPCTQFIFFVNDGVEDSANATVLIFVQFVATKPVLLPPLLRNITAPQATDIILPFSSWLANSVPNTTFIITAFPSGGSLFGYDCATNVTSVVSGGIATDCGLYRPLQLLTGQNIDSLSWRAASSASGVSVLSDETGVVTFTLLPVQFAPSCSQIRVSSFSGKQSSVSLYGYSLTKDQIFLIISKTPVLGSLWQYNSSSSNFRGSRISGTRTRVSDPLNRVVYVPPLDRYGTGIDQFTYKACDLNSTSNCGASCIIKVDVSQNQAPSPIAQRISIAEGTPTIVTLFGVDPNAGDTVTPIISYLPLIGKLRQVKTGDGYGPYIDSENTEVTDPAGRVWYFPPPYINGLDADGFGFRVTDGTDVSPQDADVIIDLTAVPNAPQTSQISIQGQSENTAFAILLGGYSPDGLTMTSFIAQLPYHGVLSQSTSTRAASSLITAENTPVSDPRGKVIYTPFQYYYGFDNFSFYVKDSSGAQSDTSVVTVQILHVNVAPTAQSVTLDNLPPQQNTRVQFIATDPDGPFPLIFVITTLPTVDVDLYQEENGQPVDKIVLPNTIVTSTNASIFVRPNVGLINFSFTYTTLDSIGGRSEDATVYGNVSAIPPSSGGGLSIGLVAGIAAGVGGGLLLLIILFVRWYRKRAQARHSIAGSLTQRKSSKDMLEKLLTEPGHQVVQSLSEVIDITEADELAQALVALFMSNDAILPLLLDFISREVRSSNNPSTLFRSNSLASKMMKVYSRKIGIQYLQVTLSALISEVLNRPGAYEVNRNKLQPDQNIETQWETLISTTETFLKTIIDSLPQIPPEFRKICSHLYNEVVQQFPGYHNAHTFVGGFLFLRFFCPAIVAPEVYFLCPEAPPMPTRRGLILVSKALQNLSNGVQFGSKEEYMMPMNPFIVGNIARIREFLLQASQDINLSDLQASAADLDPQEKLDALDVLHRHLFVHQERVYKELAKLTVGEGINRDFLEHLAAFDLLLSYPADLTEEIINTLISDLPLVTAICHSIPASDHQVPRAIIDIFEFQENTLDLIRELIKEEVQQTHHSNMLFRGYSPAMRMSKEYVDIIGLPYLQQHLGVTIKILCKEPVGYEVDPRKLPDNDTLTQNVSRLDRACQEILVGVLASKSAIPVQIRMICKFLFDATETSNFADRHYRTVADFFFGKIICPAILSPSAYDIVDEQPSAEASRVLLLITKTIQAVANSKKFPSKDILEPLNALIIKFEERMQDFLQFLVDIPPGFEKDAQSFLITSEQLDASVKRVHQHMKAEEATIRQTLTPDAREAGNVRDRLEAILLDMGPPIQTSGVQSNAQ